MRPASSSPRPINPVPAHRVLPAAFSDPRQAAREAVQYGRTTRAGPANAAAASHKTRVKGALSWGRASVEPSEHRTLGLVEAWELGKEGVVERPVHGFRLEDRVDRDERPDLSECDRAQDQAGEDRAPA